MVQAVVRTTEIPQLLLETVSMSPFPAFADEEVAALVVGPVTMHIALSLRQWHVQGFSRTT